ncbi:6-phosphofructokinase [Larkinella bovis]|uniref:ATP-dependent 6-phosphofructokinase n=1 Tax=Larkinella bovis TaxID=683041 RepID=A0ABW0I955_9BACT
MNRIAVLTSGGDAPGMNACIRAVVRGGIYHGLEVIGVRRGYSGLVAGDVFSLSSHSVSNSIQRGGTMLKSARSPEFLTAEGRKKAYEQLIEIGAQALIVIGGNGTFQGALHFFEEHQFPVIGVPGTIDNDLSGTDYTIGYDTAVNTALEAIDKIRDTADSHERIFLIEVMGRDSGYIALQSGLAGGAEMIMVPEIMLSTSEIIQTLKQRKTGSKSSSIIIVAEGEQKNTAARLADQIRHQIDFEFDIRVTTLGHIQRGGSPSAQDRLLGSRLGLGALEGLLMGKKNVMVGLVNHQLTYTPLKEAIEQKKPIHRDLLRMIEILRV